MKSFKIFSLLFAGLLLVSSSSWAQTSDKIGYLDLSRIFDEYKKTKEFDAKLEEKHTKYETERNKKIDKIKESQGKLTLMKDDARVTLEGQINKDTEELKEYDRVNVTELRKERDEKIKEILLEIEQVVKDFAKKDGFQLILNDRVLIYGSETMDITDKVIKILNDKYPGGGSQKK